MNRGLSVPKVRAGGLWLSQVAHLFWRPSRGDLGDVRPAAARDPACGEKGVGDVRGFALGEVERQLTAHGSGGFFAPHVDTGHPIDANRRISCVYYFHASPRRFTGGELKLYDTWVTPSGSTGAGTYTTAHPGRQQPRVLSE